MTLEIPAILNTIKGASRTYRRGDSLYRQGDICGDYFVVVDGWVALSTVVEDGARHIADFAIAGSFLGLQPTSGAALSHSAQCITPVCIYSFPRHKIDEAVELDPRLSNLFLFEVAMQAARATDHLVNITCREARERIAHLLMELFYRVHRRSPNVGGDSFQLPLTLQQIGDATGLTDVHVSRTLRVLREDRIVSLKDRTLTITDPRKLSELAGFDRQIVGYRSELFNAQSVPATVMRPA